MKYPNFKEEKRLWRKGYRRVACLDESGRGPLCGPVVACAVCVEYTRFNFFGKSNLKHLKDSKKLTAKKREEFYDALTSHPMIKWGIGRVSEKVIDKINILEATKLAMIRAIQKLNKKPNFLILDGKMKLDLPVSQKSIVKADEKVFSCAAASVIAKVTRDRIMRKHHKKYPRYRFDLHKGYGTKLHLRMLRKYGSCKIHRKSFGPVRACKIR
jgi:ribonuclease HII